ncbi:MAG TPA: class I SAM-dependent methyltransferase [Rhizomicrobium sp.]|jgi:SAM-dependent methyltransferase|nr:class I SAM-dependent methyltransferase [Rhizomicrobium sp.]
MEDYKKTNLAYWNEMARRHVDSEGYQTAAFRRGEIILDPIVRSGIGDVRGKKLLHLQCHFGLDTLSLARMGAVVTGLDFSDDAIATARTLSQETGAPATFVQSDVLNPPAGLTDFDIVFASWGAICWIHDIAGWMRVAANALKPGGRLFMAEAHPYLMTLDDWPASPALPFTVRYDWNSTAPLELENQGDYAGPGTLEAHRNVQYMHGMAETLNGAIDAGFRIDRLEEGHHIPWMGLKQLIKADKDYWTLPPGAPIVPLSLILNATKMR